MAGFIPGIALVPQVGPTGDYLSGCLLRIYEAGTNQFATAYKDYGLTQAHSMPIVGDAVGRIPMFFLDAGDYRLRLSDKTGGTVIYDIASIPTVGPSEGGGGEGVTIQTWEVGDVDWQPRSGTRPGWIRLNGRSIGSAASSATERANQDTENLYAFKWNNFDNTICPVSGGRGASAAADFAANKTLQVLDMRGRGPAGLDDMGNAAAGAFSGITFEVGNATTAGAKAGANTHTLTQAQLPAVSPTFTGTPVPPHTHSVESVLGFGTTTDISGGGGGGVSGTTSAAGGHTPAGTISPLGSGHAHPILQRTMLGTWYTRL